MTGSDDPPDLSIVTVNWNALEVTSACLASIRDQTSGITYEVTVIDNGSTADESVEQLPRRHPWIRFHHIPENRGFAHPNNPAIALSRGRYVLLLNNDTLQIENALGKSVAYMDERPDVGALGITHLNGDARATIQPSFYHFPGPWDDARAVLGLGGAGVPPSGAAGPPEQDVDWIVGSFMLIRRACLERVGALDERFFLYDVDIDWCLRAGRAGWRVRYWPGASMIHIGNVAHRFMRDKTFMYARSRLTYLRKHHPGAAAATYYLAMSGRLTLATVQQVGRLLLGRGTWGELRERAERQMAFVLTRASRSGM